MISKSSIPEQLWVHELSAGEAARQRNKTESDVSGVDIRSTPLIRDIALAEEGSLPCFAVNTSHALHGHPNPFLGFPSHFKFFILRNLGNTYLASFGDGAVVYEKKAENQLASTIVGLISALTSYGFQSSLPKFQALLRPLVKILDGRSDLMKSSLMPAWT